ncbi:MAG: hypothetical protein Ct9H300mP16_00590 [Pseudomonadota bacterium]|nr:MAG: hypothetical protein Ct9H300mP16_00590 [Pseudomonadota bacterium]
MKSKVLKSVIAVATGARFSPWGHADLSLPAPNLEES